jgi:hypothetical protein
LKEVTRIEVYEGTAYDRNGGYIACMVFYKGETIVGTPYAGSMIGGRKTFAEIKATFID